MKKSATWAPDQGPIAPSPRVAPGSWITSSASTSMRVPSPWHSGQAPNGELNENDRGSRSSVSIGCSLGQAIFSENRSSRPGSLAGRSTKSNTTSPLARPSAVSTESVSRRLLDALTASRSTTTSIVCFFCLSSLGGSSREWVSPLTRAREKPWVWSWRNRSTYSPLRPRITGASTWKRAPSSRVSTRSTICCGVCREIGAPQVGQCGRPARA